MLLPFEALPTARSQDSKEEQC